MTLKIMNYTAVNKFLADGLEDMTRDQYLHWTLEWKQHYVDISSTIRSIRNGRKPFVYQYRAKTADTTCKRWLLRTTNPDFYGPP